ncbi:MAG: hypothetical protein AMS23_02450 [Bacteroides sp. SM1_62]|nr:MAG: hypothetical protein AMS26_13230 [Bacteroides sp. SM23_62]KPL26243.1 MAG: hypothetical protein AMS23_02450 [Bacteroides sp. SM1_62]
MKKIQILITVTVLAIPGAFINAQEVTASLDEALSSYQSDNLEDARFALQGALTGINQAIGREILALLPDEMNGMSKIEAGDDVTGVNTGFTGLFISRSYTAEDRNASIEIVSDSPLLAGINTILAMPGFMTSDENQKRIKIEGYKALLTRNTDSEGIVSYDIQMPFSGSLLTFQCSGIDDENEVIGMANRIPVDGIVAIVR